MVNFSKPTTFLGRNGVFKVIGITLAKVTGGYDHKTPVIVIEPLTSRGLSGRCNIEIPVGDIPALIAELQKFTPQVCKMCGAPLEHDRCTDEACLYSNHEQDWDYDANWILKHSVKKSRSPKKKKKGRRCSVGGCKNLATHKAYNAGCDPFFICRKHHFIFKASYRTKPLKRYPKKVVIAHARKQNTKANARKMAWLDSGPYKVSKGS